MDTETLEEMVQIVLKAMDDLAGQGYCEEDVRYATHVAIGQWIDDRETELLD